LENHYQNWQIKLFKIHCLVNDETLDVPSLMAEHGLSLAIETRDDLILFDTGQSGEALLCNAERMHINLRQVKAIALSHAHYDHTGGLDAFLNLVGTRLPLYAHPDIFCDRFNIRNDEARSIGLSMSQAELSERSILCLSAEPVQVLPGVWTTGEITTRLEFQGSSPTLFIPVTGGKRMPIGMTCR
jgi:7,8-dihydropterin-6-yl-methyl-4-(beta-D-ribofuranosyl)aminobenzene 5'-phosphate synthase